MKKQQKVSSRSKVGQTKPRLMLLALVVGAVLAGIYFVNEKSESGTVFSQQTNRAQGKQKGKKYRATRNLVIDEVTGEPRMPSDAELDKLLTTLQTLANTSTEGLQEYPLEGGGYGMDLQGRFQGVFLSRPRPNGTPEIKCVFSFEEGIEFLGIVEDNASDSSR
jgi:hypothetical protein